jgi:hypothetical protein
MVRCCGTNGADSTAAPTSSGYWVLIGTVTPTRPDRPPAYSEPCTVEVRVLCGGEVFGSTSVMITAPSCPSTGAMSITKCLRGSGGPVNHIFVIRRRLYLRFPVSCRASCLQWGGKERAYLQQIYLRNEKLPERLGASGLGPKAGS